MTGAPDNMASGNGGGRKHEQGQGLANSAFACYNQQVKNEVKLPMAFPSE